MPSTEPFDYFVRRDDQGKRDERLLKRRRPELVTKSVCRTCNSGWMNDLDLAAQPLLNPMTQGQAVNLQLPEVNLLAAWLCKTAIVTDTAQPDGPALGQDHARYLLSRRTPPAGWRLWLALEPGANVPTHKKRARDGV